MEKWTCEICTGAREGERKENIPGLLYVPIRETTFLLILRSNFISLCKKRDFSFRAFCEINNGLLKRIASF